MQENLREIFELLSLTGDYSSIQSRLNAVLIYIMATNPSIDANELKQVIGETCPAFVYPDSILGRERQEGREEGREEGLEKGAIIGKIQLLEEMNHLSVSSRDSLVACPITQLEAKLAELQSKSEQRLD